MIIEGVEVPKYETFPYLGSTIQRNGRTKEGINNKIKVEQMR